MNDQTAFAVFAFGAVTGVGYLVYSLGGTDSLALFLLGMVAYGQYKDLRS